MNKFLLGLLCLLGCQQAIPQDAPPIPTTEKASETNYPTTPTDDLSLLSEKGKSIVKRLESAPTTVDGKVYIVKFDSSKLGDKIQIQVGSKKAYGPFYFDNCKIENKEDVLGKHIHVTSRYKLGSLSLTIVGNDAGGLIYYDNKVYSIEALENGYSAIIQVDQTKFGKD